MKTNPQDAETGGPQSTRRAEKLSALAALLGPDAMDRLRRQDDGFMPEGTVPLSSTSQERVAWQRNRLLERLRTRWPADPAPKGAPSAKPDTTIAPAKTETGESTNVDTRIASAVDMSHLADEHPAVIVRVLKTMGRKERVAVLRALPGPTARAAIRRLRASA
jgi:hypothetical protein